MSLTIRIARSLTIPDPVRLERYHRSPSLGPRLLFFSGGTALRKLSRELVGYTHNSVHLITPFDSGGSSAKLRQAFHMLAVGDIRNRLMALADRSVRGNPEIYALFSTRFPGDEEPAVLAERLAAMVKGKDALVRAVPDPLRKIVRNFLRIFAACMPEDFDLAGASVGNLILTGGYLNHEQHIDPVIYLFSKLVEARGVVRPIVNRDLHLAAELADGRVLVGQHLLTGKEAPAITSPVKRLSLVKSLENPEPATVRIRSKIRELITGAELICFPMGSFYTSLIANLLPRGVGDAVAEADCPKVFIPNLGTDPEMLGLTVSDAVTTLLRYLEESAGACVPRERLLNFALLDTKNGDYRGPLDLSRIRRLGVEVIDARLVTQESAPLLDAGRLAEHLLSLV